MATKYQYFKSDLDKFNKFMMFQVRRDLLPELKHFTDRDNIKLNEITFKEYNQISIKKCPMYIIIKEQGDTSKYWFKAHLN